MAIKAINAKFAEMRMRIVRKEKRRKGIKKDHVCMGDFLSPGYSVIRTPYRFCDICRNIFTLNNSQFSNVKGYVNELKVRMLLQ